MKSCTTVVVTGYLVGWFTSELFMYLLMFIIGAMNIQNYQIYFSLSNPIHTQQTRLCTSFC